MAYNYHAQSHPGAYYYYQRPTQPPTLANPRSSSVAINRPAPTAAVYSRSPLSHDTQYHSSSLAGPSQSVPSFHASFPDETRYTGPFLRPSSTSTGSSSSSSSLSSPQQIPLSYEREVYDEMEMESDEPYGIYQSYDDSYPMDCDTWSSRPAVSDPTPVSYGSTRWTGAANAYPAASATEASQPCVADPQQQQHIQHPQKHFHSASYHHSEAPPPPSDYPFGRSTIQQHNVGPYAPQSLSSSAGTSWPQNSSTSSGTYAAASASAYSESLQIRGAMMVAAPILPFIHQPQPMRPIALIPLSDLAQSACRDDNDHVSSYVAQPEAVVYEDYPCDDGASDDSSESDYEEYKEDDHTPQAHRLPSPPLLCQPVSDEVLLQYQLPGYVQEADCYHSSGDSMGYASVSAHSGYSCDCGCMSAA